MITRVLFSLILTVLVAGFIYWRVPCDLVLIEFYSKNIRGSLFTGFLTLGGFLLSLKTFIIVKMKENVYDNSEYIKIYERNRKINQGISLYGPLKNLSDLLYWAILSCIVTSVLQFSLGLYAKWWSVVICISAAVFSIVLLLFSLLEIKSNLNKWFELIENTKT